MLPTKLGGWSCSHLGGFALPPRTDAVREPNTEVTHYMKLNLPTIAGEDLDESGTSDDGETTGEL